MLKTEECHTGEGRFEKSQKSVTFYLNGPLWHITVTVSAMQSSTCGMSEMGVLQSKTGLYQKSDLHLTAKRQRNVLLQCKLQSS